MCWLRGKDKIKALCLSAPILYGSDLKGYEKRSKCSLPKYASITIEQIMFAVPWLMAWKVSITRSVVGASTAPKPMESTELLYRNLPKMS
jgi:hypothetical protein